MEEAGHWNNIGGSGSCLGRQTHWNNTGVVEILGCHGTSVEQCMNFYAKAAGVLHRHIRRRVYTEY